MSDRNSLTQRLQYFANDFQAHSQGLRDAANLLEMMQEHLLEEDEISPDNLDRALTLFRALFLAVDGSVTELQSIHQAIQKWMSQ